MFQLFVQCLLWCWSSINVSVFPLHPDLHCFSLPFCCCTDNSVALEQVCSCSLDFCKERQICRTTCHHEPQDISNSPASSLPFYPPAPLPGSACRSLLLCLRPLQSMQPCWSLSAFTNLVLEYLGSLLTSILYLLLWAAPGVCQILSFLLFHEWQDPIEPFIYCNSIPYICSIDESLLKDLWKFIPNWPWYQWIRNDTWIYRIS